MFRKYFSLGLRNLHRLVHLTVHIFATTDIIVFKTIKTTVAENYNLQNKIFQNYFKMSNQLI